MKTDKYLYIVRHGQSVANVDPKFMGEDAPLTDKGVKESEQLAERLTKLPIEVIISSTLLRAKQTAEIASGKIGKEIIYTDDAVEKSFPKEAVGTARDSEERGEIFNKLYDHDDINFRLSDEETLAEASLRAKRLLSFLEDRKESHIALISHAAFLHVMLAVIFFGDTLSPRSYLSFVRFMASLENTALAVLRFKAEDKYTKTPRWRLVTWNDYAHLG